MINYSIVMRPVNANLIAINQAKGRIKEGKTVVDLNAPANDGDNNTPGDWGLG